MHTFASRLHFTPSSYGRYTVGVLRNAQLAPLVYPGWKVRVYLDESVPPPVVHALERLGAQLVRMRDSRMAGGIGGICVRDGTAEPLISAACTAPESGAVYMIT